jgi:hypothetical protein
MKIKPDDLQEMNSLLEQFKEKINQEEIDEDDIFEMMYISDKLHVLVSSM